VVKTQAKERKHQYCKKHRVGFKGEGRLSESNSRRTLAKKQQAVKKQPNEVEKSCFLKVHTARNFDGRNPLSAPKSGNATVTICVTNRCEQVLDYTTVGKRK